jgi:hypothetical protein
MPVDARLKANQPGQRIRHPRRVPLLASWTEPVEVAEQCLFSAVTLRQIPKKWHLVFGH